MFHVCALHKHCIEIPYIRDAVPATCRSQRVRNKALQRVTYLCVPCGNGRELLYSMPLPSRPTPCHTHHSGNKKWDDQARISYNASVSTSVSVRGAKCFLGLRGGAGMRKTGGQTRRPSKREPRAATVIQRAFRNTRQVFQRHRQQRGGGGIVFSACVPRAGGRVHWRASFCRVVDPPVLSLALFGTWYTSCGWKGRVCWRTGINLMSQGGTFHDRCLHHYDHPSLE